MQENIPHILPQYSQTVEHANQKINYEYRSKIRYVDNAPIQNETPIYPRPQIHENLKRENQIRYGNTNHRSDGHIKKDRLYRHDFEKDSDEINDRMDNPTKRQVIHNSVPCHGASKYFLDKCVLVKKLEDNEYYKRHSSFPNIQNKVPASQISSLPYKTQIPRHPISNGRKPYMSYEPTIEDPINSVKSLPQYTPPANIPYPTASVRSLPQYPYKQPQRSSSKISFPNLILAKRKTRSDVYSVP